MSEINFFFRNPASHTACSLMTAARDAGYEVFCANPLETALTEEEVLCGLPLSRRPGFVFMRGSVDAGAREYMGALSRHYESLGVPVVNPSSALSANKWNTLRRLAGCRLPVSRHCMVASSQFLSRAAELLGGFPLVVKFLYGGGGTGVNIAESPRALRSLFDSFRAVNVPVMLERFYPEALKGVVRIIGCAGRALCAFIMLPPDGDFRSNLAGGGAPAAGRVPADAEAIALQALAACGVVFGAVDLLLTSQGPLILEVNSSPGIEVPEKILGRPLAPEILAGLARHAAMER